MKKRFENFLKSLLWGVVITTILLIAGFLIASKIIQNKDDLSICLAVMAGIIGIIYTIFAFINLKKFEKYQKLYNMNAKEKVMNELTSEFKPVILRDSGDVPTEKFKCQAKVDENGKIICRIYVDYQTKLNSYEEFLKYFHLNEE